MKAGFVILSDDQNCAGYSDTSANDEVGMNNTVELYFEDDDETETYKIVTTIREDSLEGRISNESPIGRAIMGHKEGGPGICKSQ